MQVRWSRRLGEERRVQPSGSVEASGCKWAGLESLHIFMQVPLPETLLLLKTQVNNTSSKGSCKD